MHCMICYNVVYLCVSLSVTICIQTAVGAHHVDNAHLAEKVVELEGHLQALRMEMDQKSEVINSLRKQLVSSQHDKAIADRELRKLCNVFNFRVFYNKNFQIVLYYHFSIVTEHSVRSSLLTFELCFVQSYSDAVPRICVPKMFCYSSALVSRIWSNANWNWKCVLWLQVVRTWRHVLTLRQMRRLRRYIEIVICYCFLSCIFTPIC